MNRSTDLLEPTVPDLLELDSDFLRLDFPFDLRGISLLNFRNCRRQPLQIFLQKHNFQKWTFPTGNYCKQQKAWQNWKNCQNDGADSFSIDNDDRKADDDDDDEKSLVALEGVNLNRRSLSTSHCFALLGKRTQFKCAKNGTQMQLNRNLK